jgi:hypothetical protein
MFFFAIFWQITKKSLIVEKPYFVVLQYNSQQVWLLHHFFRLYTHLFLSNNMYRVCQKNTTDRAGTMVRLVVSNLTPIFSFLHFIVLYVDFKLSDDFFKKKNKIWGQMGENWSMENFKIFFCKNWFFLFLVLKTGKLSNFTMGTLFVYIVSCSKHLFHMKVED